jgi:hypothetical protein
LRFRSIPTAVVVTVETAEVNLGFTQLISPIDGSAHPQKGADFHSPIALSSEIVSDGSSSAAA